ncbi:MAG TPA: hypothetical protein VGE72_02090 [Azospirillum sp.]
MSPLVTASLIFTTDPDLGVQLDAIARREGLSVAGLCKLVDERRERARHQGRPVPEFMVALRVLVEAYWRYAEG